MKTGSREYEVSVNQELSRSVEELAAIHAGDNRYVEWLREELPKQHAQLVAFPAQIQALIGVVPIKLLVAVINCQIAAHRFYFESWAAREQVGTVDLARLMVSTGWEM
jgi:hypothetical protein